ncbi:MAG: type II toxin-antitoxin system RelE/ParE family toxin [Lacipirellulaceae bacterium]
MTYRVRITSRADAEIDEFIEYVACVKQEPVNAARLLNAISEGVESLSAMPQRCAVAPESRTCEREVRVLIVKKTLLVLFTVDEVDRVVIVQGFRHGSRRPLDLGETR